MIARFKLSFMYRVSSLLTFFQDMNRNDDPRCQTLTPERSSKLLELPSELLEALFARCDVQSVRAGSYLSIFYTSPQRLTLSFDSLHTCHNALSRATVSSLTMAGLHMPASISSRIPSRIRVDSPLDEL